MLTLVQWFGGGEREKITKGNMLVVCTWTFSDETIFCILCAFCFAVYIVYIMDKCTLCVEIHRNAGFL